MKPYIGACIRPNNRKETCFPYDVKFGALRPGYRDVYYGVSPEPSGLSGTTTLQRTTVFASGLPTRQGYMRPQPPFVTPAVAPGLRYTRPGFRYRGRGSPRAHFRYRGRKTSRPLVRTVLIRSGPKPDTSDVYVRRANAACEGYLISGILNPRVLVSC